MRIISLLLLPIALSLVGCGGAKPATLETSAVENYVQENPDAVAQQARIDAMAEAEGDDDE